MIPRPAANMTILGATMLVAIAFLHASGYRGMAEVVAASDLPDFLKAVLPPLFLYPSVLLVILAVVALLALYRPSAAPFALASISTLIAANAVFGLILGGLVPGGVLLLAASLFLLAAYFLATGRAGESS